MATTELTESNQAMYRLVQELLLSHATIVGKAIQLAAKYPPTTRNSGQELKEAIAVEIAEKQPEAATSPEFGFVLALLAAIGDGIEGTIPS